ncbi:outer membrane protein [Mesorhizobium shangrilense]|uniref:Outer membrane protein n=1 Tax=Mesorhizobium shangrilense TaxID=460060 RepID=A0ABV2DPN9_9HYPH
MNGAEALPVAATYNWSGGYVGAQIGYAWGRSVFSTPNDDETGRFDPDSVIGGLYLGYNHQINGGPWVVGVDGDLTFGGEHKAHKWSWSGDGVYDPDHVTIGQIDYAVALRARVGYAVDRWLPYVAGGVSTARFAFALDHDGTENWDFQQKQTLTGWNIGVGVEYAATDNLVVRAEYRYTDFGSKNYYDANWDGESKINLSSNDLRLGVAYKF